MQRTVVTVHKNIFVPACRNVRFALFFLTYFIEGTTSLPHSLLMTVSIVRALAKVMRLKDVHLSHMFDWSNVCCSTRGTNTDVCAARPLVDTDDFELFSERNLVVFNVE